MDSRRTYWIGIALAVVIAIGVPLTASAQTPPGAATGEPYTPAKDAKDLKAGHRLKVRGKGRVAVVADQTWIRASTRLESALLPNISYRVYMPEERAEALAWVTGASG